MIDFFLEVVQQTGDAIFVVDPSGSKMWIPKAVSRATKTEGIISVDKKWAKKNKLIPKSATEKKNAIQNRNIRLARQLQKSIIEARAKRKSPMQLKFNTEAWAMVIGTIPAGPEFQSVFKWTCKNLGFPQMPEIRCATHFATHYDQLCKMYNSDTVEPSEKAHQIAREAFSKGWRGFTLAEMTDATEAVLCDFSIFKKRLDGWIERNQPAKDRLVRFAEWLSLALPRPPFFARWWLDQVHHRITGWDGFDGDTQILRFKITNRAFQFFGRELATEYCHKPELWDKLLEKMDSNENYGTGRG